VTGAARGIGQAIAAGLAERGARIVLGDIGDVSETSDLIGATGHPAVPVTWIPRNSACLEHGLVA
jgi:NAD(P)-dependent dehydrogenase (short-subunit alcohol dehydrogenase family)